MTAEKWDGTDNPNELLRLLPRVKPYTVRAFRARKLRLIACGILRASWDELPDDLLRASVVTAEAFADGATWAAALADRQREVAHTAHWLKSQYVELCYQLLQPQSSKAVNGCLLSGGWPRNCHIIRDVFGNPFRQVAFDPAWSSSTVVDLAQAMYESRDFAAMPVLADAIEEAGCDHPDVLAHCRNPEQVHVRGCWVVDLVLGKA